MPLWSYLPPHMTVSHPPKGPRRLGLAATAGNERAVGNFRWRGRSGFRTCAWAALRHPRDSRRPDRRMRMRDSGRRGRTAFPRRRQCAHCNEDSGRLDCPKRKRALLAPRSCRDRRTESDAGRRPNDPSSSETRRAWRRNIRLNRPCTCIAAHASLGTNRPCVEFTARWTDPTVRAAGTSCVALFGIGAPQAPFESLPA